MEASDAVSQIDAIVEEEDTFPELPHELWMCIFRTLKSIERRGWLTGVCATWRSAIWQEEAHVRFMHEGTKRRFKASASNPMVEVHGGEITAAVLLKARRGPVRSIEACGTTLVPAVAQRIVPELLGAGCSLIELDLSGAKLVAEPPSLQFSWANFGEAAVCSEVLRELDMWNCGLQGPLPELRLPALEILRLSGNNLTGGLEPIQGCPALQVLWLHDNQLAGGLEPLSCCTALRQLWLYNNHLTGGLEPLHFCTALQDLKLGGETGGNMLTGGLDPLRSCTALLEVWLNDNQLTGGLQPLHACTTLQDLWLHRNQLTPTEEDIARLEEQCQRLTL